MLDRSAVLGITFGTIFGSLFLLACIISARKAVRDRREIKNRNAKRQLLKVAIETESDQTEPNQKDSTNSPVYDVSSRIENKDLMKNNECKMQVINTTEDVAYVSNNSNATCSNICDSIEMRTIELRENNSSHLNVVSEVTSNNCEVKHPDQNKEHTKTISEKFCGVLASSRDEITSENTKANHISEDHCLAKDKTYFGVRSVTGRNKIACNGMSTNGLHNSSAIKDTGHTNIGFH